MNNIPDKFPKVQSPYKRVEDDSGNYIVTDEIKDEFDWVFERASEVDAVEKLHGTNIAVQIENNKVSNVASRLGNRDMQLVDTYGSRKDHYVVRGVQNSINRGYLNLENHNGWIFGELVGTKFQNNPYNLDENVFIPFDWLRRKATYRSYGKYSVEFDGISGWLESDIFSIYKSLMNGKNYDETRVSNGSFVEGIVFVHPDLEGQIRPADINTYQTDKYESTTNMLAKLRRDMYEWY